MAEQRTKSHRISLKFFGKAPVKLELFPSDGWAADNAPAGLFRVRVAGAWHCAEGERLTFVTLDQAFALARALAGCEAAGGDQAPALAPGQRVRVPTSGGWHEKTFVKAGPFQGADGRWRVYVVGRADPVLVDCTTPVTD